MGVYVRAKFEVSSIVLTSFRQWGEIYPPPPSTSKQTPKKPIHIKVKKWVIKAWKRYHFKASQESLFWQHLCHMRRFERFGIICIILKTCKETPGGMLFLVKPCNITKSNTPPLVFFTFFKLCKWYQITQSITCIVCMNNLSIHRFFGRKHCVKNVRLWSFFWSVFACIRFKYRKVRTRKNSVFGHFSRSEIWFD